MEAFVVGQRWINEAELSLGLGTLVGSDGRTVRLDFGAIAETRTYARQSAALSRAQFEVGDRLKSRDGVEILVESIQEAKGLITYRGQNNAGETVDLHEMDLSDFTQLNRANQRLFSGQIDKPQLYQLRQSARLLSDEISHAETRGLISGRTSLIPHQLFIADEVAHRQSPRVLLADEVGLGKTIEAGLILNSRLINGTAQRILIVVPEHLINQWLVEMLRRFNLHFSLFDKARLQESQFDEDVFDLEADDVQIEPENPFESEQLVLCSPSLFKDESAYQQALAASWDMLVVDEAHHLEWTQESASDDYLVVEQLAARIPSVLLLTATPEQLGKEGHFARLRLLDPARFYDYQKYLEEEKGYSQVAEAIELLESNLGKLTDEQWVFIQEHLGEDELVEQLVNIKQKLSSGDEAALKLLIGTLIGDLLDRHGTGRLLFRNTRAAIKGFPERKLHRYPLQLPREYRAVDFSGWRQALTPEISFGGEQQKWTDFDPRVTWLFDFLKQQSPRKILVIAAHAETALDLSEALRVKTGMSAAVFHEHMSIIERDRAAAYFADEEYGAQCLICSEIGSEGRNFQFAHDMVLFDLPANPDLLEQRIGRLDRIGQTETINIHVPFLEESAQANLVEFYHQSLNAFEKTSIAALGVIKEIQTEYEEGMERGKLQEATLARAKELRLAMEEELHGGRDFLLERNSCKHDVAEQLVEKSKNAAKSHSLSDFMQMFSDNFGVAYEQQTNGTCIMRPTESMTSPLNGLPDEGLTLTYDRDQALANEDIHFFTWDHPVVVSALDSVLSAEMGNTSLVTMKVKGVRPGSMMLESVFILEPPGNKYLQSSRFLPSTRIRLLLDQSGRRLDKLPESLIDANQQRVKRQVAGQIAKAKRSEIKALLDKANEQATKTTELMHQQARANAESYFDHEIARLESLQQINPSVRSDEIQSLKETGQRLIASLNQTEVMLDALRVVVFT